MMTAPIALAVFGGLASATVITLFFIPVMYSLINGRTVMDFSPRQSAGLPHKSKESKHEN
jgi:hypothetical protein